LSEQDKIIKFKNMGNGSSEVLSRETLDKILALPGSEALNRILDFQNAGQIVRDISRVDLFWLMKKIGEDDFLPLLRLASFDQWQYIMDMELWHKDRIDLTETIHWIDRFHKADPERLAQWLYSEDGNLFAHYFFNFVLEVKVKEEQDYIPPDGFFTYDNLYYISIPDKEHEEVIEQALRQLSSDDYNRFQALMLGLAGVIPAEVEEEMYRLKSIRLAEDGYLPYEEAISIYSYQQADLLKHGGPEYKLFPPDEEMVDLVPISPLAYAGGDNIFTKSLSRINDNLSFERLRLEFAGLCNQILSADAIVPEGVEDLVKVTKKVSGYLNLGLERLSSGDIKASEEYIRNNPLVSIFRVGFGMTLELKWDAEKKINRSWFRNNGFDVNFWGEEWGGIIKGILMKRPLFYKGEYKSFENMSEVESAKNILQRIVLLDRLVEEICTIFNLRKDMYSDPLLTYHTVIFHSWAIKKLNFKTVFLPFSLDQAKNFFNLIRGEEAIPPFNMLRFHEVFMEDFMSLTKNIQPYEESLLRETLEGIWEEFKEEYSLLNISDIDPRFTKYLIIS
jgi:hypothetical protein